MKPDARRRPRGVGGERELVDVAAGAEGLEPRVAELIHVTSVGWGRRIVSSGLIEARRCPVFDKDLLYFFLARPAYRFAKGDEKADQLNLFPFAIVLSPEALPQPHHVYPFDTGAFMAGFYDNVLDPSIYIEDYELDPDLRSGMRHVAWGFGSTRAYYEARLTSGLELSLPAWMSVSRSWIAIASLAAPGRDRPDRRASAIEVAYSRSVDLRGGHARLLVFPQQLLEDPRGTNVAFLETLRGLDVEFATYDWRPNETPDSYAREIETVVADRFGYRSAA